MKRLVNGKIESYYKELPQTLRRQDNPSAYFPYGVAYNCQNRYAFGGKTLSMPADALTL